jgi:hypothetical protein
MGRAGWWALAIVGVLVAFAILASALAGIFTAQDQFRFTGNLLFYGFIAAILGYCVFHAVNEFQAHDDWTRWTGLFPLAAYLIIGGGVWAWFGYFIYHHAVVIWPVIVVGLLAVLVVVRAVAENRQREKNRTRITKLPELPNTSGASKLEDFKDW